MIRMVFSGNYRVPCVRSRKLLVFVVHCVNTEPGSLIFMIARKEELFDIGAKYDLSFIYLLAESYVTKH